MAGSRAAKYAQGGEKQRNAAKYSEEQRASGVRNNSREFTSGCLFPAPIAFRCFIGVF
jgi:hypothetical protein